ncbi:FHA domain-containing protein [Aliidiomarina indica]|uniref:FHA domain-containing protein n=1 Tax=Aliidiomarina indica TaxID=2749147 RepID=UPI00188EC88C|nr:FHA domain-containing protein [Aliidiomarina indica]
MPLRLQLRYPHRPAESHILFEGKDYLLGRADDCDIIIDDPQVSRYHARLEARTGNWTLVDHNSQNGCFNGADRINKLHLAKRAEISLGPVSCYFEQVPHRQITAESSFRQWRSRFVETASEQMFRETSLNRLLMSATETLSTILSSDRAAVIFLDEQGDISRCTGFPEWMNADQFTGSRTAIQQALTTNTPVVLSKVSADPLLSHAKSVIKNHIQALLCYPVTYRNQVVAVLYADSTAEQRSFLDTDLVIVRAFARQLSMALQVQDLEQRLSTLQAI